MSQSANLGRVGPNAIIRVLEALQSSDRDRATTDAVFQGAAIAHYLETPPAEMVIEQEVIALQRALRDQLGIARARAIAHDAGLRTGDYLLANRIPGPAQTVLKLLPARLASRVLLKAIGGNAWTFVGTGVFESSARFPPKITIHDSLLCRGTSADQPVCDFYTGTFERLFRVLVNPNTVVTETACRATGAASCVFEIRW